MDSLKYKVIKSKLQYKQYCSALENLLFNGKKNKSNQDEVDLLTLLIEKWDEDHNTFTDADPIALLRSLMDERNLKAKDMVEILGVSKGLISDILNYKKGLSKEIIRTLSEYFKIGQEAFNRPYKITKSDDQKLVNV